MKSFANKIRELRVEKKLTQKQIAGKLGISETGYAGYEQGYREPDFSTLIKICRFFEVSSDYLLGLEEEDGTKIYTNTYNNYGTHKGDVKF